MFNPVNPCNQILSSNTHVYSQCFYRHCFHYIFKNALFDRCGFCWPLHALLGYIYLLTFLHCSGYNYFHLLQHSEIASFTLHCVTGVCAARVGSSMAARWHVDSRPCDSGMWTAGTVGVGSRVRTLVYWRCHWRHQHPPRQLWLGWVLRWGFLPCSCPTRRGRPTHHSHHPSPTHSFIPGLILPFLQILTTAAFPFLLEDWLHRFPGLFTDTSEHVRFLLFSFFCFPFCSFWFHVAD